MSPCFVFTELKAPISMKDALFERKNQGFVRPLNLLRVRTLIFHSFYDIINTQKVRQSY